MCNGTLDERLCSRDMESLAWKKRLEICIGAAKGLHYLHTGAKCPIFHRDITTRNILLDSKMVPKLSLQTFSLQGKFSKLNQKSIEVDLNNICGTFAYLAPENLIKNSFITDKCDVYSFGMVLLNVVCRDRDLSNRDKNKMKIFWLEEEIATLGTGIEEDNEVLDENILTGDNFCDKFLNAEIIDPIVMRLIAIPCLVVFINIVKKCLKLHPNERPAMGEVEVELEHALEVQEEEEKLWK